MIYTHTRSWKSRVVYSAATLLFAYPLVAIIMHVLQWRTGAVLIGLLILVGNSILFGHEIYDAMARRRNFVCTITERRLICECPSAPTGYSFDIAIAEILEVVVDDDDVILKLQDGLEYRLTSNYGNPRGYFIKLILQANPAVRLERR